MKKFILLLVLLSLGGISWATPDVATSTEYTQNTQIKSTPGVVYTVNVNYVGATAGQTIQILDGVGSSASTSPVRFTCTASASAGTCRSPYGPAYYFGTGVFYKDNTNGGIFKTDIQSF